MSWLRSDALYTYLLALETVGVAETSKHVGGTITGGHYQVSIGLESPALKGTIFRLVCIKHAPECTHTSKLLMLLCKACPEQALC